MKFQEEIALMQRDDKKRTEYIQKQVNFIVSSAHEVTGRAVTKDDNEFNVARAAFDEAIMKYDATAGKFFAFAETLIYLRLTDALEKQEETESVSVAEAEKAKKEDEPILETEEPDTEKEENVIVATPEEDSLEATEVEGGRLKTQSEDDLDEDLEDYEYDEEEMIFEIQSLGEELRKMQISFAELVKCSPESKEVKRELDFAVDYIMGDVSAQRKVLYEGIVPVSKIMDNTNVSRKILEQHRKYIIALVVILLGDYPLLSNYINA